MFKVGWLRYLWEETRETLLLNGEMLKRETEERGKYFKYNISYHLCFVLCVCHLFKINIKIFSKESVSVTCL